MLSWVTLQAHQHTQATSAPEKLLHAVYPHAALFWCLSAFYLWSVVSKGFCSRASLPAWYQRQCLMASHTHTLL